MARKRHDFFLIPIQINVITWRWNCLLNNARLSPTFCLKVLRTIISSWPDFGLKTKNGGVCDPFQVIWSGVDRSEDTMNRQYIISKRQSPDDKVVIWVIVVVPYIGLKSTKDTLQVWFRSGPPRSPSVSHDWRSSQFKVNSSRSLFGCVALTLICFFSPPFFLGTHFIVPVLSLLCIISGGPDDVTLWHATS